MKKIRKFDSGAVRDSEEGKPDFFGFFSPIAMKKYGEYMTLHQKQSDGTLRSSDNWKKGIPQEEYVKSLNRHVVDLNLHYEGFPEEAREDQENALAAIIFNAQGLLYELLKTKKTNQDRGSDYYQP